jgi:hypothetical protein
MRNARWRATDAALQRFESGLASIDAPSDADVFGLIKSVVESLNDINGAYDAFDTIDREELCEFIDDSLTDAGIDVAALAARRGVDRAEITDEWRDF